RRATPLVIPCLRSILSHAALQLGSTKRVREPMMSRSGARSLIVLLVLAATAQLSAATFTATQSGNWSSASTWGGAGVPGAGDTATVNGGHVVTLDVPVTVATLTLSGGQIAGSQSLAVTSTFNWNSGTLSGSGSTTAAAVRLGG